MAARLARAACGSLQLLWVGSRDLQKICLLQCGTSPTPFLEGHKKVAFDQKAQRHAAAATSFSPISNATERGQLAKATAKDRE